MKLKLELSTSKVAAFLAEEPGKSMKGMNHQRHSIQHFVALSHLYEFRDMFCMSEEKALNPVVQDVTRFKG